MRAAACSTTERSGVAMAPFVPPFSAFIGVCMYLGLYVEPRGFVSCFHFLFCFIKARVLLSPPHTHPQSQRLHRAFHLDPILLRAPSVGSKRSLAVSSHLHLWL